MVSKICLLGLDYIINVSILFLRYAKRINALYMNISAITIQFMWCVFGINAWKNDSQKCNLIVICIRKPILQTNARKFRIFLQLNCLHYRSGLLQQIGCKGSDGNLNLTLNNLFNLYILYA